MKFPKWTNGRAFVIEDAVFAIMGAGTNLVINSAYVLAGEFSKIKSSNNVPQALERYEKVFRRMFYAKVGGAPSWFPQALMLQTSWGFWIRDSIIWFMAKTKVYKLAPADSGMDGKLPDYDWVDFDEKENVPKPSPKVEQIKM